MIEKKSIVFTIVLVLVLAGTAWLFSSPGQRGRLELPNRLAEAPTPEEPPQEVNVLPSATFTATNAAGLNGDNEQIAGVTETSPSPAIVPVSPTAITGSSDFILPAAAATALLGLGLLLWLSAFAAH